MFTELATGVWSYANRFVDGKCGIVVGKRCALAVDACYYPDEAQAMADFIRAQDCEPNRVALTHGHSDHVLGGLPAFAGAEVFAHTAAIATIRKQVPGWVVESGESQAQVEARLLWPTITFTDEVTLDLGGKHARLFRTPGHSADSVCIYVEEDRVLFGGDTAVTGIVSPVGDGNAGELEPTLRRLATMEIETLVPGHGAVLSGVERVREWLTWLADYLSSVRAFVRAELAQGRNPQDILEAVDFARFIGDRLPADQHGMPRRHRNTVHKIIEEEMTSR